MKVRIRLFAQMRLAGGASTFEVDLPHGAVLREALETFYEVHPGLRAYRPSALAAVGWEYSAEDLPLKDGDEISLIPPVQGG